MKRHNRWKVIKKWKLRDRETRIEGKSKRTRKGKGNRNIWEVNKNGKESRNYEE